VGQVQPLRHDFRDLHNNVHHRGRRRDHPALAALDWFKSIML